MRDKQCDVIRRELEELSLNEEFSETAAGHMRECADCRDFQRQQVTLRQIIGNLGTVHAPADFDFRLRARLAADSDRSSFRYWSFAVRGLATVAVLVVFGVGAVVVWQRTQDPGPTAAVESQTAPRPADVRTPESRQGEPVRHNEPTHPGLINQGALVADNNLTQRRNTYRSVVNKPGRTIAARDISSEGANVLAVGRPALDSAPVFPIDASLQSVKVSFDDGRGNERTISFPTVSFGSQRVLAIGNQIAPKRVW